MDYDEHDAEGYFNRIAEQADASGLFGGHCHQIPRVFYENAKTATWDLIKKQSFALSLGWRIVANVPDNENAQHFKLNLRPRLSVATLPSLVSFEDFEKIMDERDFSDSFPATELRRKAERHANARNRMLFRPSYFPFRGLNDKEASDVEILNGLGIKVSNLVGDDQTEKREDMRKQIIVTHKALKCYIKRGDRFCMQVYDEPDNEVKQVKPGEALGNVENGWDKSFPIGKIVCKDAFCYIWFAKRVGNDEELEAVKSGVAIDRSHGGYAYVAKRLSSHSIDDIVSATIIKHWTFADGSSVDFKFTPNLYKIEAVHNREGPTDLFEKYVGERSPENGLGGHILKPTTSCDGRFNKVNFDLAIVKSNDFCGNPEVIIMDSNFNFGGAMHGEIPILKKSRIPRQVDFCPRDAKTDELRFKLYAPPIYVLDTNPEVLSIQMKADACMFNWRNRKSVIVSCYELVSRVMSRHVKIDEIPSM